MTSTEGSMDIADPIFLGLDANELLFTFVENYPGKQVMIASEGQNWCHEILPLGSLSG
jgi:hypothetical protein